MLKGKSALITGSTGGIGLSIARHLAAQGCNIMLNGFGDPVVIEQKRTAIEKEFNVRASYHGADMSKLAEISDMMNAATQQFNNIDILVNNVGTQHTAPVDQFPVEKWDLILSLNLSSAFHTIRHALPMMKQNGWGRIINTASVHGLVASVNKAAYVAAKHGLVGLTKVVALETAGQGITCNAFCPGWTHTELIEPQIMTRASEVGGAFEDGVRSLLSEKQPSKQLVKVEQLAQLVVFLCSGAADQITGVSIPVDGGWTAQ
jgi:3-hydroxybutyrate dehydrogenase